MCGMRKRRENGRERSGRAFLVRLMAVLCAFSLVLSGCRESKKAKEARLQGIEQLKQERLEEAIVSFDAALKEADGIVDEFELDILKYRGEAEYRLGDYEAAAHTYEILTEVDGEKPEYLRCVTRAKVHSANEYGLQLMKEGNSEDAIAAFEKGIALAEESGEETLAAEARQLLSYNIGAAYEAQGDFARALDIFTDYVSVYGMTEKLEKEIAFLHGRIN